jgi:regulator of replication initiation timing
LSSGIHVRPRPEDDELRLKRSELEDLQKDLVEKELQLTGLRAELAAFERLYLKTVGVLYAELDEIEARIAELVASRTASDADAQATARQARQKAAESHSAVGEAALQVGKRSGPTPELKNLYREVARRIHPDLGTDETDRSRRQQFMTQANRAYEDGDEARLRSILEEYDSSPDTVAGDGIGADLVRVIRKISQVKRRLTEIDEELNRFVQSELMDLKNRVEEGTKHGREVLAEMANAVCRRIDEARERLSSLSKERAS